MNAWSEIRLNGRVARFSPPGSGRSNTLVGGRPQINRFGDNASVLLGEKRIDGLHVARCDANDVSHCEPIGIQRKQRRRALDIARF
jgi:hypothetical protein